MKNILIISGHPNLQHSLANAEILAEVGKSLPQAEIRKLDALYPNRLFDIAAEQDALLKADVIVLQFPFSWYSVPGLMKLWIDEVFVHGFAHGSAAKLGGKKLIVSFTTGAPAALYQKDGLFKHSVEDYLINSPCTPAVSATPTVATKKPSMPKNNRRANMPSVWLPPFKPLLLELFRQPENALFHNDIKYKGNRNVRYRHQNH